MSDIEVEVVGSPSTEVEVSPLGATGPAGPTAVSADAGNVATLGTDGLLFVPESAGGASDWGDLGGDIADQADLQEALADKSNVGHTHAQADVDGLDDALAGKAAAVHGHTQGDITGLVAALAALAPLASPALTGAPTVPTAAPGTNSTQAASTAFVIAAIAQLIGSAPGLLDTLDEIAAALNDDPNFAATMTTALAGKAPISHTHAQSDVTGLGTALTGKSDTGHTHAQGDVSGLTDALAALIPKSLVDAKGDLLVATANDIITRLAVGTDGYMLTADASQTAGVKWAANAALAAGSAMNPHMSASATRNSALSKNFWQCSTVPTNWLAGDEWIQP